MDELKDADWHKECEVPFHPTHVCATYMPALGHVVRPLTNHDTRQVWLYRGAWQEWEPELIDMAVPMSPHEKLKKRLAIFKHQSQKDPALFPGTDAYALFPLPQGIQFVFIFKPLFNFFL